MSPLSRARDQALARLGDFGPGTFRATVIVSAFSESGSPRPDMWTATEDCYGGAGVLRIDMPGSCSAIARAGCVAAVASLGMETLFLLGEGVCLQGQFAGVALAVVEDHVNFLGDNPLIGSHDSGLGPRFPDMSGPYSIRLRAIARRIGGFPECIYAACPAGSLENAQNREICAVGGAGFAGVWIVPEVIAARQAGMEVLAFVRPSGADYDLEGQSPQGSDAVYAAIKEVCTNVLAEVRA